MLVALSIFIVHFAYQCLFAIQKLLLSVFFFCKARILGIHHHYSKVNIVTVRGLLGYLNISSSYQATMKTLSQTLCRGPAHNMIENRANST